MVPSSLLDNFPQFLGNINLGAGWIEWLALLISTEERICQNFFQLFPENFPVGKMNKGTRFNISSCSNVEITPSAGNTSIRKFTIIPKISKGKRLVAADLADPFYQFSSFFGFQNQIKIGVASPGYIVEGSAKKYSPFY